MDLSGIIQLLLNGLSLGGLYALMAIGLALIYGILDLVNFAYGEIVMVAGYTLYVLGYVLFPDLPWIIVAIAAVVIAIATSLILERVAFRPVRLADPNTMLITSFAVSMFLQNSALLFIAPRPRPVHFPAFFSQVIRVGDLMISKGDLLSLLTSLFVLGLLTVFMRRTILGSALRAAASDFTMTRLLGIRANQIIAIAFAISGCLAGVVSIFWIGRIGSVFPAVGLTPVLIAFVASVVGGLGSLEGAVMGGYLLGFSTIALNVVLPRGVLNYRPAFLFGIVILILVFRPGGLTGRTTTEKL